jgi:O-acetyl-ADP-ribose deacetylase
LRIIHAVGPIVGQAGPQPADVAALTNAYQNSLRVGSQNNITAVAFPPISTGIYNYNINAATPVAIQGVLAYLNTNPAAGIQEVRFVTFNQNATNLYRNQLLATPNVAQVPLQAP